MNENTGEWCKLPYPNHPKGCPNFGKKSICPPQAPWLHHHFNINRPLYLVHSEFDLEEHRNNMKQAHPEWSTLQCQCVLYWQPKSRKQLIERTGQAMQALGCNCFSCVPEAMGLNVYATARKSGLKLEKIRNLKTCKHVALIGHTI